MRKIEYVGRKKGNEIKVLRINSEDGKWFAWAGEHPFEKAGPKALPLPWFFGAYGATRTEALDNLYEALDMMPATSETQ